MDLVSPSVTLILRGFDVNGVKVCGLALERRDAARPLMRDSGDDYASEGRPYFARNVHGVAPPPPTDQAALDDMALNGLLQRLDAALGALGALGANMLAATTAATQWCAERERPRARPRPRLDPARPTGVKQK